MKLARRSFLTGAALGAGALVARPRWMIGDAHAAGERTPYPVLQIVLVGGVDSAMHFVGRGTLKNRPSGGFKTAPGSGIVYFPGTVAPAGATDFEPHIAEMALLRGFNMVTRTHEIAQNMHWYGGGRRPWANYLASELLKQQSVPKPCAIALPDVLRFGDAQILLPGDASPNPSGAAERILDTGGFFGSLAGGASVPSPALQAPLTKLVSGMNVGWPGPAQPSMREQLTQSNTKATSLLSRTGGPVWPPTPQTMSALGLTNADITATSYGAPRFKGSLALAYQSLQHGLSHVVSIFTDNLWDSHADNVNFQINASSRIFPTIGKLLTLMKNTVSPIDPTKTLFDTTNVWISSEFNRGLDHDSLELDGITASGLSHWEHSSTMFLGGRFKRGVAIGDLTANWRSAGIDLATGAPGGTVPQIDNVIATVFKAAGADPTAYTNAAPIDALLL